MADATTQRSILVDALQAGVAMSEPDLVALNYRWVDDNWKQDPLSWTRQRQDALDTSAEGGSPEGEPLEGGDTRTPRSDQPAYQSEADHEAALGSSFEQQCMVCIGIQESNPEPAQD